MIAGADTQVTQLHPVNPGARNSECPNVAVDFPSRILVAHLAIIKVDPQVPRKDKVRSRVELRIQMVQPLPEHLPYARLFCSG